MHSCRSAPTLPDTPNKVGQFCHPARWIDEPSHVDCTMIMNSKVHGVCHVSYRALPRACPGGKGMQMLKRLLLADT